MENGVDRDGRTRYFPMNRFTGFLLLVIVDITSIVCIQFL